jgi:hypothetical protein
VSILFKDTIRLKKNNKNTAMMISYLAGRQMNIIKNENTSNSNGRMDSVIRLNETFDFEEERKRVRVREI